MIGRRRAAMALLMLALQFLARVSRSADDANWPQFRGPGALGIAENPHLPDTWTATENVAWKTEIAGRGWSCPIVWRNRAFLTTATGGEEAAAGELKRGIYFGGDQHEPSKSIHQWRVIGIDLADGRVIWNQVAHQGPPAQSIHLKNTYATETPVTDGARVYAYFGNLGVFCYDLDGKQLWSRPLGSFKTADGMGTGGSPVVHQDRLYVLNDNEEQSFLVALDAKTGAELWRTLRPEKSSWSTPYIWQHQDRTEIVVSGSSVVRSYDLDGKPLWQLGEMTAHSIPTPVAGAGLLYVSSGHVLGKTRPILAIRPGARGDITLAANQSEGDFIAWSLRKASPYNTSPLLYGDYLYVLTDLGLLNCYDARSGRVVYEKKRLPNGRAFTASPWAYNGNVFCLSEYGETFVVKAGPEFELLHVNPLAEDDMCLATPAIAADTLLVRSDRRLYAIRRPAETRTPAVNQ